MNSRNLDEYHGLDQRAQMEPNWRAIVCWSGCAVVGLGFWYGIYRLFAG